MAKRAAPAEINGSPGAQLLPGRDIAAQICADVAVDAKHLQDSHSVVPQLAIIEVGEHNYGMLLEPLHDIDGPTEIVERATGHSSYAQLKATMAERCGIRSRLIRFSQAIPEWEVLKVIGELMTDPCIHGILVELPLPPHLDEQKVLGAIGPHKDVDGLNLQNVGSLSLQRTDPLAMPCVAQGIMEVLLRSKVKLAGEEAVVLGRSSTVGTPVAMMLRDSDCTVTLCHSQTRHVEEHVRRADIVVACVGRPGFVRGTWLKLGAVVVDVGMNSVKDETGKPRIVGDVCFEEAKKVTSRVTPVPGGIGHVSFAVLLRNVVNLARHSLGLAKLGMGSQSVGANLPPQVRAALLATADWLHFEDLGLRVPQLLLPRPGTDLTKWCVIACDQYTSQPEYWKQVREFVGDAPSTLSLIFPEVYLDQGRDQQIIQGIRDRMYEYDRSGILQKRSPGFVLVDRKTPIMASRKGLLVELDLELYSFAAGSQSLIRPTEKTIESRLPPRVAIRQQASVELPHIMVLIDDPECTVIEPLVAERDSHDLIYDFELMQQSGHLTGHHIASRTSIARVASALRRLADPARFRSRYGAREDQGVLLYPVGDGNHSLATARRCWDNLKRQGASMEHPARFALVELMNIHDPGLEFEPIHRLVFHVEPAAFVENCVAFFRGEGFEVVVGKDATKAPREAHTWVVRYCAKPGETPTETTVAVLNPKFVLAAATFTTWFEPYLDSQTQMTVDYVHGTDVIDEHCKKSASTVGVLMPSMDKNDLVRTVVQEGVLPKKTFSMGEADEKRFYFEARRILPETCFYRGDFFRRGQVSVPLQARTR